MRIRAAVVEDEGAPFAIQELELGELRADEVLVEIAASGAAMPVRLTSVARNSTTRSVSANTIPANDSAGPSPVIGTALALRANSTSATA